MTSSIFPNVLYFGHNPSFKNNISAWYGSMWIEDQTVPVDESGHDYLPGRHAYLDGIESIMTPEKRCKFAVLLPLLGGLQNNKNISTNSQLTKNYIGQIDFRQLSHEIVNDLKYYVRKNGYKRSLKVLIGDTRFSDIELEKWDFFDKSVLKRMSSWKNSEKPGFDHLHRSVELNDRIFHERTKKIGWMTELMNLEAVTPGLFLMEPSQFYFEKSIKNSSIPVEAGFEEVDNFTTRRMQTGKSLNTNVVVNSHERPPKHHPKFKSRHDGEMFYMTNAATHKPGTTHATTDEPLMTGVLETKSTVKIPINHHKRPSRSVPIEILREDDEEGGGGMIPPDQKKHAFLNVKPSETANQEIMNSNTPKHDYPEHDSPEPEHSELNDLKMNQPKLDHPKIGYPKLNHLKLNHQKQPTNPEYQMRMSIPTYPDIPDINFGHSSTFKLKDRENFENLLIQENLLPYYLMPEHVVLLSEFNQKEIKPLNIFEPVNNQATSRCMKIGAHKLSQTKPGRNGGLKIALLQGVREVSQRRT